MTSFRVWAPSAASVAVRIDDTDHPLARDERGWWSADVAEATHGTDYAYVVDGAQPALPDPRSAWQPHGVHGPSRVVDHASYRWQDAGWHGRRVTGGVIYEMHVGTFTAEGTFDAAVGRLDHLVELGVDAVEVMPVAAFPGRHGWGYDGVHLWAVHEPYGGPDGFKRFVDAAHQRGLAVILDVVYNHLGPSGNYLGRFGPYFTDKHSTPWGAAVNLDDRESDEVRRFVVDNALMWLRDYHVDGLRLDAVHALQDDSATHVLEQLATEVDDLSARLGRPLTLIAESDLNDPKLLRAREAGGYGLHAQWSDDFHHALHSAFTGETLFYYEGFGSLRVLAETLQDGWYFNGRWSPFRRRTHGRPFPDTMSAHALLGYLQTHDQIGNRAAGERISALTTDGLVRVGAALVLTSPYTCMLFMGEEWGASTPWQYFTDHTEPELAEAVRNGRRNEFAEFGWAPEDVPDPQDPETVERSRLDWAELDKEPHASLLAWHRELVALRRREPDLADGRLARLSVTYDEDARWLVVRRGGCAVACNLSTQPQRVPLPGTGGDTLADSSATATVDGDGVRLDGESVAVVRLT